MPIASSKSNKTMGRNINKLRKEKQSVPVERKAGKSRTSKVKSNLGRGR